jgi:transposase
MEEKWKDAVGLKERYEVSDQGRVRNKFTQQILKPAPTSKGYLSVSLYDGSRPKKPRSSCVHDLVTAAFVGPKPASYQVDHGEKGKQCNALKNLEYVTPAENIRRFDRTGKRKRYYRADHANAKLTADQVSELRRLAAMTPRLETSRLAKELGVSCTTVYNAARARTYVNVVDYSLAV